MHNSAYYKQLKYFFFLAYPRPFESYQYYVNRRKGTFYKILFLFIYIYIYTHIKLYILSPSTNVDLTNTPLRFFIELF